jgi:hypothetical protein
VPAAATLGDVVEQHAEVERAHVLELVEDPRERRLLRVASRHQPVERLDGAQRVLVDRVLVEEVVLDQERDPRPLGDQPLEDARLVERPERRLHAAAVARHPQQQLAALARAPHERRLLAQRRLELARQRQARLGALEHLEHGGSAAQRGRGAQLQRAGPRVVPARRAVQAQRREQAAAAASARAPIPRTRGTPRGAGRAAVVVAHQQLRGQQAAARPVAEARRDLAVQVQRQHVGPAPRREVCLVAQAQQEVVGRAQRLHVGRVEQAGAGERREAAMP